MHKPLFRIAAGSVVAVGGLLAASAMPAGAATAVLAADTPPTCPATGTGAVTNGSATANNGGDCANTTVTFDVTTTGVLAISAPITTQSLGAFAATGSAGTIGTSGVSNFGAVVVNDTRAAANSTWTATVASTDFTTGAGLTVGVNNIPASAATYATDGVGAFGGLGFTAGDIADVTNGTTGGGAYTAAPITLANGPTDIVTETGYDGDNAATWSPTIIVHVPSTALVGTYSGTVTHSVA